MHTTVVLGPFGSVYRIQQQVWRPAFFKSPSTSGVRISAQSHGIAAALRPKYLPYSQGALGASPRREPLIPLSYITPI